jgi:hypothetical protein
LASYAAVSIAPTAVLPKLLLARNYAPLYDPSVQSQAPNLIAVSLGNGGQQLQRWSVVNPCLRAGVTDLFDCENVLCDDIAKYGAMYWKYLRLKVVQAVEAGIS